MAALTYFEEKVHRKRLRRVGTIPLLFRGDLLGLRGYGIPFSPHLECRRHCRELFTGESWTQFLDRSPKDQGIPRPLALASSFSSASRFSKSLGTSMQTARAGPACHKAFFLTALVTCTHDTPTPLVTPAPAYPSLHRPSITISALSSSSHVVLSLIERLSATLAQHTAILDQDSTMLSHIHHHRAYHLLHLRSHIHDWIFLSPFCICFCI
ncbi:hypothetical protein AAG906_041248 [Vitis piasezkii]